eukprot:351521_1
MWIICVVLCIFNILEAHQYHARHDPPDPIISQHNPPDSIISQLAADPMSNRETFARTADEALFAIENAHSDAHANALYSDNNYDEYTDFEQYDELLMYDLFDDDDEYLWNHASSWDQVEILTLQNDQKVTQKCAFWEGDESFCLCQINGHQKKYECKETEGGRYFSAAKRQFKVNYARDRYLYEEAEWDENDSSDDYWKALKGTYNDGWIRNKVSEHHLFNQGIQGIIDRIEGNPKLKMQKKSYAKDWTMTVSERVTEDAQVNADKFSKRSIDGRIGKLFTKKQLATGDTADPTNIQAAKHSIINSLKVKDFGSLINQFRPTIQTLLANVNPGLVTPDGYGYLIWDMNKDKFGEVLKITNDPHRAGIYYKIDDMIDGGVAALSRTKPALVNAIGRLFVLNDEMKIEGLERWGKNGIREGKGPKYGKRGFSVGCPVYIDCPILRFLYENKFVGGHAATDGWQRTQNWDLRTGQVLDVGNYANWLLIKEINHHLFTKLRGVPDDLERFIRIAKI